MPHDESSASSGPGGPRPRRERSARYPGVPLAESIDLARFVDERGLDGLGAPEIALALGYKNIKTNTFSARLSAARQFGLLDLKGEGYHLTPLARSILHPVDPTEVEQLQRQALLTPPLYSDLAERFADKKLPEASILGNVLYHNYDIIGSAKQAAADAFLESAKFAGILGPDQVLRPKGGEPGPAVKTSAPAPSPQSAPARATLSPIVVETPARPAAAPVEPTDRVLFEIKLWDADQGKSIRVRAPESITTASFERFLQAFRLLVRIEDEPDNA